ncbi:MAG: imidazole glycerol phosphate synthase subunit HisH [Chloroflexota bacterium]
MAADRTVVIIDYGAGNLHSVTNAVKKLGYTPEITSNSENVLKARAVILPGVGAAGEAMKNLKKAGLVLPIRQIIKEGRPFFGVCLGLQLLLDGTEENGGQECLGIIPGKVKKLPDGLKTPHMGWNQVRQLGPSPLFTGIPDKANFYFVHSYYAEPEEKSVVVGETDYGITMCSIMAQGDLLAAQFHPEKSGEIGLKMYDNFLKLAVKRD